MVPKVAGKGSSFKGAALYYLHDKGALTAGRVWFVHTENLPTRDPDKAIRCMAWTALHQQQIKARSGASTKGRKLAHPVYTYSLSWAPGEAPKPEEMIEAARETVRALGLEGHEMLFVAHNDEPHPHIHVIVNRVHPETGIAAKLSNDHLKLSAWAEAYEKRQGLIRCEQRVENNERRRRGAFVRDRESENAAAFHRWRRMRVEQRVRHREEERKGLSETHWAQRQALYQAKEHRIRIRRGDIRANMHKHWSALYQHQQREYDKLDLAQRTVWTRLRHFLHTKAKEYFHAERQERMGLLSAAFSAVVGGPKQYADLEKKHREERASLGEAVKRRQREAFREINAEYRHALARLKKVQLAQQRKMRERQTKESQQQARDIKSGKELEEFTREQVDKAASRSKRQRDFEEAVKPEDRPPAQKDFEKAAAPPKRIGADFEKVAVPPPKKRAGKEFGRAGHNPEPPLADEKGKQEKKPKEKKLEAATEKTGVGKRLYKAFRDLRDGIGRDRGKERTIERKPPKGPKFD